MTTTPPQPFVFKSDVLWMDAAPYTKYHYLCAKADTEVGFMCRTHPNDPLHIVDIEVVKQESTSVTVDFDDDGLEDYMHRQLAQNREPRDFFRVWAHTHPGDSPHPSSVDEKTNLECFSNADWNVMLILAKGGDSYARLTVRTPSCHITKMLKLTLNHLSWANAVMDTAAWDVELAANLSTPTYKNSLPWLTNHKEWTPPTQHSGWEPSKDSILWLYAHAADPSHKAWRRSQYPELAAEFDLIDQRGYVDPDDLPQTNTPTYGTDTDTDISTYDVVDDTSHPNINLCDRDVQNWYDELAEDVEYTSQILSEFGHCEDSWYTLTVEDLKYQQNQLRWANQILDTQPLTLTMELINKEFGNVKS